MTVIAETRLHEAPRPDAYNIPDAASLPAEPDALHPHLQPYCLTERDVRCLEQAVAIAGGPDTPIGHAVADKLGQMDLCASVPDGYVTLNSDVTFRIGGRSPINRVLVHWDRFSVPGTHLSLHTAWGVTLLGMRVGHTAPVYGRCGVVEEITVESVRRPRRGMA